MAEYLIQDTTLIEIANAIRNKSEKTEPILVSNFAKEINALEIFNGTPPVLDSTLPANASFIAGGSVTCHVLILEVSDEEEYRYQWYVNNTAVIGATQSSYTITSNTTGTITVYCNVSNSIGTTSSRVATITVKSATPSYTYGGTSVLNNEGNNNWNIMLKTSGTLKFTDLGNAAYGIEVFLCGGGGSGGSGYGFSGGGGGGGGYTTTKEFKLLNNMDYAITIGGSGGNTSAFGLSAAHGNNGGNSSGDSASGGSGTGAGGRGGSGYIGRGGDGQDGITAFNTGNGTKYGAGGGGGTGARRDVSTEAGTGFGYGGKTGGGSGASNVSWSGGSGAANTGGGGGGSGSNYGGVGGAGGSGIVIIRNKRS